MTNEHEQQLGQLRVEFRDFKQEVNEELKLIRENHLAHIQTALNELQLASARSSQDLAWLLKFFWIVVGATLANVATTLFSV